MKDNIPRAAWVEIHLDHLAHNLKEIRRKVGPSPEILGVVKADGYGHGALPIVRTLKKNGVSSFGVATLEEAIQLRETGMEDAILILGLTPDDHWPWVVQHDLMAVVCSFENAKTLSQQAVMAGKKVPVYVALDTGMGRIGYLVENSFQQKKALEEISKITTLEGLSVEGLFSHMATADSRDKSFSYKQEGLFLDFQKALKKQGVLLPKRTLANSASIMEIPSVYYDVVRPGIILYGCLPSEEVDPDILDLKPVMEVKARILHLKKVESGFSVGYGRTYITERPSVIATLPLGYADGLPRVYSNRGRVLYNGQWAPVVGNICMDQTMIDVTLVPDVKLGDTVTLLGREENLEITAQEIGKLCHTINYEVVCRFGQRLPKVYLGEE
jgi:alanine racemase